MSVVQMVITIFDVLAIVLLGIVSNAGLRYVQNGVSELPKRILETLKISNYNFELQFSAVCLLILLLFALRTFLSIYGNRRILLFLGERGATASNNFIKQLFESHPKFIANKNSQELLYGVTSGVDNLVLNYLGAISLLVSESVFLISITTVVLVS